jgi:hypothetical protein
MQQHPVGHPDSLLAQAYREPMSLYELINIKKCNKDRTFPSKQLFASCGRIPA